MPFSGPSPAEWLNDVTLRAKFDAATGKITTDADDWGNLVSAAQKAYHITDEDLAALNDPPTHKGRRVAAVLDDPKEK